MVRVENNLAEAGARAPERAVKERGQGPDKGEGEVVLQGGRVQAVMFRLLFICYSNQAGISQDGVLLIIYNTQLFNN